MAQARRKLNWRRRHSLLELELFDDLHRTSVGGMGISFLPSSVNHSEGPVRFEISSFDILLYLRDEVPLYFEAETRITYGRSDVDVAMDGSQMTSSITASVPLTSPAERVDKSSGQRQINRQKEQTHFGPEILREHYSCTPTHNYLWLKPTGFFTAGSSCLRSSTMISLDACTWLT